MSLLKNKFVIIILIAIILWWVFWFYITWTKKPNTPTISLSSTWTGNVKEVLEKLNDLAK